MYQQMTSTPIVMSITANDPSGGSGISADIETLSSLGCHCTPIITKLSARDTHNVEDSQITDTPLLIEQTRAILEDIPVNLINIGDLASTGNIEAVHTILRDYPTIPIVFHPKISNDDHQGIINSALHTLILPLTTLTIVSRSDAMSLVAGADSPAASAQGLLDCECSNVLLTGSNRDANYYMNQWYNQHSTVKEYQWQRLPNSFHGAICTLAAAVSAYLAHGLSIAESIQQAQQFTWQALRGGRRIGMGELFPDRMHWSRSSE